MAAVALALFTQAYQANAQSFSDKKSDSQCMPVIVNKCGCGQIVNPKTGDCEEGDNKYQCGCTQTDNGASQVGVCDESGICQDKTTNGKSPSAVTPQQVQQANNGSSANGTTPESSAASPQVSSNPGVTAPPASPAPTPTVPSTASQNSSGLTPGSSMFENAYQQAQSLMGNPATQPVQLTDTGSANSQPGATPSWLSDAQQVNSLSPSADFSPSPQSAPTDVTSSGPPGGSGEPTFQSNSAVAPDNLPFSAQDLRDVQAANDLVTQTPAELAAQDLKAIQNTAQSVGGWVESAFQNQPTSGSASPATFNNSILSTGEGQAICGAGVCSNQFTSDQLADLQGNVIKGVAISAFSETESTAYGGVNDPSQFTAASKEFPDDARIIQYNPSTGDAAVVSVNDTGPFVSGRGLDTTPAAMNAIGVTSGLGTVDAVYMGQSGPTGYIGNFASAADAATAYAAANNITIASNFNPWNTPAGSLPVSAVSTTDTASVATVNDYADYALSASQYQEQLAVANAAASAALAQENAGFANSGPPPATALQNTQEAISVADQNFVEAGPANPSGVVEQGPELEQPYPAGTVTSSALPLSDQQIAAQIPTPETAQTNPQADIEAANQTDSQNVEAQLLSDRLDLADTQTAQYEQALADAESKVPVPNTDLQSGPEITSNIQPFPTPEVASTPLPTQAEMQADLLKQGQDMSSFNANSFYNAVEGPTNEEIASQIPVPESADTNPQQTIEAANAQEATQAQAINDSGLQDRLSLADAQTAQYEQALADAESKVPVPDTSDLPTGEKITNDILNAAASAPVDISATDVAGGLTTGQANTTEQPATQQPSFTQQVAGTVNGAVSSVEGWYQQTVTSLQDYALNREFPTPTTFEQTGDQITSQIQQTVAGETIPDVSNADRQFSVIDTGAAPNDSATNGTTITSAMFSPNSVAFGAASYNPAVAQAVSDATQFNQAPIPASDVPLPAERPAEAGTTGIDLNGCGGVCEEGNTGADVKAIQQFLNEQGYSLKVDGIYGPLTEDAVETFQKGNNIQVDGVVGPQTLGVMNSVAATEGALVPATQSGEDVTAQVQQAAAQSGGTTQTAQADTGSTPAASGPTTASQPASQSVASAAPDQSANDQAAKPEATYTLSNAGDLRSDFLANPSNASLVPDSMVQQLREAYDTGASSVTFTQSDLDSMRWDLMDASQRLEFASILAPTGYQPPPDTTGSATLPPGMQNLGNMQIAQQDRIATNVCWTTGFCY